MSRCAFDLGGFGMLVSVVMRVAGSVMLAGAIMFTGGSVAMAIPQQSTGQSMGEQVEPRKKNWVNYRVSPGAFCSERGWWGRSKTGLTMRCKTTSTDSRYRWRQ